MMIKPFHLELYAKVREYEKLFYHARDTLTSREDLTVHANDFLTSLSSYEKIVPSRVRERLKDFRETKDLATKLRRVQDFLKD